MSLEDVARSLAERRRARHRRHANRAARKLRRGTRGARRCRRSQRRNRQQRTHCRAHRTGGPDTGDRTARGSISRCAMHSPRTSFFGVVPPDIEASWDIPAQHERLLEHFTVWAEAARDGPDDGREPHLEEADALLDTFRWAVANDRLPDAIRLGRAIEGSFCLTRRWGAWREVLVNVNHAASQVGDRAAEAWSLHQLGTRAFALGHQDEAVGQLERALQIRNEIDDGAGVAATRRQPRRHRVSRRTVDLAKDASCAAHASASCADHRPRRARRFHGRHLRRDRVLER